MHLLSFGSARVWGSLRRVGAEARRMGCFDSLRLLTPLDLDGAYWRRFGAVGRAFPKGYGLWTWKPHLLNRVLSVLPDGAELVYVDAGCSLQREGVARLRAYFSAARRSAAGWAAFEQPWAVGRCTKRETLRALGADTEEARAQRMISASAHFVVASAPARLLAATWCDWMGHLALIDDSPSAQEHPTFVAHRHDQSVFSIVGRRAGVALFDDESWCDGGWSERRGIPVHTRRWRHGVPWPTAWLERPRWAPWLLRL